MRYFFFLAGTIALLTQGVIVLSLTTLLVFYRRSFEGICTGFFSTPIRTIAVTAITPGTDDHLLMAALAIEQSAGIRHRQKKADEGWIYPSSTATLKRVAHHARAGKA